MTIKAMVPMAHVAVVARSIAFYEALGFTVTNTMGPEGEPPTWAALASGGAELMLVAANGAIDMSRQGVIFYVYSDDVRGLRGRLTAAGIEAGPLSLPPHNPNGEFRVLDPDGYLVMVTHI
jgi:catechol 2,3-dioxygenase-like lactoylglutathione lyase family enzyme